MVTMLEFFVDCSFVNRFQRCTGYCGLPLDKRDAATLLCDLKSFSYLFHIICNRLVGRTEGLAFGIFHTIFAWQRE